MHTWTVVASMNGVSASHTISTRNKAMDSEFTHNLWTAYGVRDKKDLDGFEVASVVYAGIVSGSISPSLLWTLLNQITLAFID